MYINVSGYMEESIVDGPGVRFVLFVQGCPHHCEGCHNKHTWAFEEHLLISAEELFNKIQENKLITGVTFSGGEPFCQSKELVQLAKLCKSKGYDIVTYTGYKYEDIQDNELLNYIDYLVDGRFELEHKSLSCLYRGSTNQRIIDVKQSKARGIVVEVDYETFGK